MLPFALVGCLGWQAIPAMTIISFALLGIDEIGLQVSSYCQSRIVCALGDRRGRWQVRDHCGHISRPSVLPGVVEGLPT